MNYFFLAAAVVILAYAKQSQAGFLGFLGSNRGNQGGGGGALSGLVNMPLSILGGGGGNQGGGIMSLASTPINMMNSISSGILGTGMNQGGSQQTNSGSQTWQSIGNANRPSTTTVTTITTMFKSWPVGTRPGYHKIFRQDNSIAYMITIVCSPGTPGATPHKQTNGSIWYLKTTFSSQPPQGNLPVLQTLREIKLPNGKNIYIRYMPNRRIGHRPGCQKIIKLDGSIWYVIYRRVNQGHPGSKPVPQPDGSIWYIISTTSNQKPNDMPEEEPVIEVPTSNGGIAYYPYDQHVFGEDPNGLQSNYLILIGQRPEYRPVIGPDGRIMFYIYTNKVPNGTPGAHPVRQPNGEVIYLLSQISSLKPDGNLPEGEPVKEGSFRLPGENQSNEKPNNMPVEEPNGLQSNYFILIGQRPEYRPVIGPDGRIMFYIYTNKVPNGTPGAHPVRQPNGEVIYLLSQISSLKPDGNLPEREPVKEGSFRLPGENPSNQNSNPHQPSGQQPQQPGGQVPTEQGQYPGGTPSQDPSGRPNGQHFNVQYPIDKPGEKYPTGKPSYPPSGPYPIGSSIGQQPTSKPDGYYPHGQSSGQPSGKPGGGYPYGQHGAPHIPTDPNAQQPSNRPSGQHIGEYPIGSTTEQYPTVQHKPTGPYPFGSSIGQQPTSKPGGDNPHGQSSGQPSGNPGGGYPYGQHGAPHIPTDPNAQQPSNRPSGQHIGEYPIGSTTEQYPTVQHQPPGPYPIGSSIGQQPTSKPVGGNPHGQSSGQPSGNPGGGYPYGQHGAPHIPTDPNAQQPSNRPSGQHIGEYPIGSTTEQYPTVQHKPTGPYPFGSSIGQQPTSKPGGDNPHGQSSGQPSGNPGGGYPYGQHGAPHIPTDPNAQQPSNRPSGQHIGEYPIGSTTEQYPTVQHKPTGPYPFGSSIGQQPTSKPDGDYPHGQSSGQPSGKPGGGYPYGQHGAPHIPTDPNAQQPSNRPSGQHIGEYPIGSPTEQYPTVQHQPLGPYPIGSSIGQQPTSKPGGDNPHGQSSGQPSGNPGGGYPYGQHGAPHIPTDPNAQQPSNRPSAQDPSGQPNGQLSGDPTGTLPSEEYPNASGQPNGQMPTALPVKDRYGQIIYYLLLTPASQNKPESTEKPKYTITITYKKPHPNMPAYKPIEEGPNPLAQVGIHPIIQEGQKIFFIVTKASPGQNGAKPIKNPDGTTTYVIVKISYKKPQENLPVHKPMQEVPGPDGEPHYIPCENLPSEVRPDGHNSNGQTPTEQGEPVDKYPTEQPNGQLSGKPTGTLPSEEYPNPSGQPNGQMPTALPVKDRYGQIIYYLLLTPASQNKPESTEKPKYTITITYKKPHPNMPVNKPIDEGPNPLAQVGIHPIIQDGQKIYYTVIKASPGQNGAKPIKNPDGTTTYVIVKISYKKPQENLPVHKPMQEVPGPDGEPHYIPCENLPSEVRPDGHNSNGQTPTEQGEPVDKYPTEQPNGQLSGKPTGTLPSEEYPNPSGQPNGQMPTALPVKDRYGQIIYYLLLTPASRNEPESPEKPKYTITITYKKPHPNMPAYKPIEEGPNPLAQVGIHPIIQEGQKIFFIVTKASPGQNGAKPIKNPDGTTTYVIVKISYKKPQENLPVHKPMQEVPGPDGEPHYIPCENLPSEVRPDGHNSNGQTPTEQGEPVDKYPTEQPNGQLSGKPTGTLPSEEYPNPSGQPNGQMPTALPVKDRYGQIIYYLLLTPASQNKPESTEKPKYTITITYKKPHPNMPAYKPIEEGPNPLAQVGIHPIIQEGQKIFFIVTKASPGQNGAKPIKNPDGTTTYVIVKISYKKPQENLPVHKPMQEVLGPHGEPHYIPCENLPSEVRPDEQHLNGHTPTEKPEPIGSRPGIHEIKDPNGRTTGYLVFTPASPGQPGAIKVLDKKGVPRYYMRIRITTKPQGNMPTLEPAMEMKKPSGEIEYIYYRPNGNLPSGAKPGSQSVYIQYFQSGNPSDNEQPDGSDYEEEPDSETSYTIVTTSGGSKPNVNKPISNQPKPSSGGSFTVWASGSGNGIPSMQNMQSFSGLPPAIAAIINNSHGNYAEALPELKKMGMDLNKEIVPGMTLEQLFKGGMGQTVMIAGGSSGPNPNGGFGSSSPVLMQSGSGSGGGSSGLSPNGGFGSSSPILMQNIGLGSGGGNSANNDLQFSSNSGVNGGGSNGNNGQFIMSSPNSGGPGSTMMFHG